MNYLTYSQYREYGGQLDEETFNSLIDVTQSVIDMNTFNRLLKYETLPDNISKIVSKATFYQLEYINNTGGLDGILGQDNTDNVKSESIGKYSVTVNSEDKTSFKIGDIVLNTLAANELDKAYLRNRWIGRC